VLVCFAWVFFRAQSIEDAITALVNLSTGWASDAFSIANDKVLIGTTQIEANEFGIALVALCLLEAAHALQQWGSVRAMINRQHLVVRWFIYSVSLWVLFLFGVYEETEFIYFAF